MRITFELHGQARADFKTAFSQRDGRYKQLRPRQLAVLLVCRFQHFHDARHADGTATHHTVIKRHRLAISADKQVFIYPGRCSFAAVKSLNLAAGCMQHESTAANAAGLRLNERQHHLHSHRRVNGRAACAQHLQASVGGQWIGSSNCKFCSRPARLGSKAPRSLRLRRRCVHKRCRGGGAGPEQAGQSC